MRNFRKLPSYHKFFLWKKTDTSLLKDTADLYGYQRIRWFSAALLLLLTFSAGAQQPSRGKQDRCGTMPRLQLMLSRNQAFKARFENERVLFNRAVQQGTIKRLSQSAGRMTEGERVVYKIPVVFHIVLPDPNVVTDAQIQAQLDTINKDYFGENGDTVKIPSYFKSVFGRSSIQFCLAQRNPDGDFTSGIERIATTRAAFSYDDDAVKTDTTGGADSWNNNKYMNVWITTLSGGVLGYSTFPEDGAPAMQGVVIDYRTIPGGSLAGFNEGKTLTHEAGHYFNLYHTWGDDNGDCTGTDYVNDTPNQADATSGCPTGIQTDKCTPGGNGIMYQNYMDYSDDPCLVMFTAGQVSRMESAVLAYRSSLLSSDACAPPVATDYDVQLRAINQPAQRICTSTFTPVVTIRNRGNLLLTSATINVQIDNGPVTSFNWTGSLAQKAIATVTLGSLTSSFGNHILKVYTTNPNSRQDEEVSNDTLTMNFQYVMPVTSVSESFEGSLFPPQGWDILNPDEYKTWKRVTGVAKTGSASVMIDNYNYNSPGQKDDLRMPTVNLAPGLDTAILSFNLAAATYTASNTSGNTWDTLEVLVSTDCGKTYTGLYKKWGPNLVTRTGSTTSAFVPASDEWRKDSIDLASFIGKDNLLITFRNTTGWENNIYLDDINLRTVMVNPNLKKQKLMVTPSPTTGIIAVQFYPQPNDLRAIQIFNGMGQKVAETVISNGANNYYSYDLSAYAAGTYIVRAIYTDRVLTRRIIKL